MNDVDVERMKQFPEAYKIGLALLLENSSQSPRSLPPTALIARVIVPSPLKQLEFLYDGNGHPYAMISWAWVSDAILQKALSTPMYKLDRSDWKEGALLMIVEVILARGSRLRSVVRAFLNSFPEEDEIVWISNRKRRTPRAIYERAARYRR